MDSLPYENATAGGNAMAEIERILHRFGCSKFGTMRDYASGEIMLQFEWRERRFSLVVSVKGYAAKYLEIHPWNSRRRKSPKEYEAEALRIAETAAPSILRDWIKAQITVIEIGLVPFDHLFLPFMLTTDGRPALDLVRDRLGIEAPR